MNIIIPAAGLGSRFSNVGYQVPKPFIPIKGSPMIEHVVNNIATPEDKVYIIMLLEHFPFLNSTNLLHRGNISFIPQVGRLQGATKSVLLARQFIDNDEPLVIANSDQWIRFDKQEWRSRVQINDGTILTFNADHPKWSYAKTNGLRVQEVAEKKVISNNATVGVYGYRKGKFFIEAADKMIEKNITTNGEFYICPAYNELLDRDICIYPIKEMYGLGTPEDLEENYNEVGVW